MIFMKIFVLCSSFKQACVLQVQVFICSCVASCYVMLVKITQPLHVMFNFKCRHVWPSVTWWAPVTWSRARPDTTSLALRHRHARFWRENWSLLSVPVRFRVAAKFLRCNWGLFIFCFMKLINSYGVMKDR